MIESYKRDRVRLLVVVEGTNDVEFLRRISRTLFQDDSTLLDLQTWEDEGKLVFIPFGGSHVQAWIERLAPLGIPEFHLYDHELPPESDHRLAAAAKVNRRGGAHAVLTAKRSLENYLHPAAIRLTGNIDVEFDDFDPVASLVAKQIYCQRPVDTPWELHSKRARNRMTQRAKGWLNTVVASRMTPEWIRQRDGEDEIKSWLRSMLRLARAGNSHTFNHPSTENHHAIKPSTGGTHTGLFQRRLDPKP